MCDATPIGSSADEAFERAQQADPPYSGLRWEERQDGELELVVMFPDDDPRSGSSCVISARDGKVTRTGIGTYIFD